jgi:hypothetical protein
MVEGGIHGDIWCVLRKMKFGTRFGRLLNFVESAGQPHKIWKILQSLPNFIGENKIRKTFGDTEFAKKIWNDDFDLQQAPSN